MCIIIFLLFQYQVGDPEGGPGRRLRKTVINVRRQIDYVANIFNHIQVSFLLFEVYICYVFRLIMFLFAFFLQLAI